VRLSSFEVSPVGFEQPGASTGFGRSSELAHFLASVLLTLEAHVPSAATGGLELVGATIKVIPVEGVTVKVSAASHAGLPLVLTPGANEVPADCEGTTVLQVATALDAVFAVCDHAAGC
jgi:ATP-dependent Lon protease